MTCTQLARKLGKGRQATLRLARRRWEYLKEFGQVGTVPTTICKQGQRQLGGRQREELLFNRPQVLYLISKSETPTASASGAAHRYELCGSRSPNREPTSHANWGPLIGLPRNAAAPAWLSRARSARLS